MILNTYILATVGSVDFSLFLLELPVLAFRLFLYKKHEGFNKRELYCAF